MWIKIICHYLILVIHMTNITRDRVCPIYALIWDDIGINVDAVIKSAIKKMHYHQQHSMDLGDGRLGF